MKNQGFTLLELLVVIAIIGILASIVLVSYPNYAQKARLAKTMSWAGSLHSTLGASTAGAWSFDNITGATVYDDSGNGNNGTISGATRVAGVDGKFQGALSFDGANDYVNVGNGSSIHPTKYITISAWVKPASTQITYADIAGNHNVDNLINGYVIQQSGSATNLFSFAYGNGSTWQGGTVLTQLVANQWNFYVVQKDDTVMKSYLNGVLVGQENVSGDISYAASHPIYIGVGWAPLTRYFNGLIDDVRIYKEAYTQAQVEQLYVDGLKTHLPIASIFKTTNY